MSILDQTDRPGDPTDRPRDGLAHVQLVELSRDALGVIGSALSADLAAVVSAPAEQDRMVVTRSWGLLAPVLPAELFAPAGSLLAHVSRVGGFSRLRLLPLLGVPGAGQGRGMGSTLAVRDFHNGLLLIARLPHRPAFTGADLAALRQLLQEV